MVEKWLFCMHTGKSIFEKILMFSSWKSILVWKLFSLKCPKRFSDISQLNDLLPTYCKLNKETLWYFLKLLSKGLTNPFTKAFSHTKYTEEAIFGS